jgi:hypothetical protein
MQVATHSTSLALAYEQRHARSPLKDAWGLSAIRVTYQDHPDDLRRAVPAGRGAEILEAAGALRVTKAPVASPDRRRCHLARHLPDGHDPATSVIDKYHRATTSPTCSSATAAAW